MRRLLRRMLVVITMGVVTIFGTAFSWGVTLVKETVELFLLEMEEVERGVRLLIHSLLSVQLEEEEELLHYRQDMDSWLRVVVDLIVRLHVEVSCLLMRAST
jgi:hypothetical protein